MRFTDGIKPFHATSAVSVHKLLTSGNCFCFYSGLVSLIAHHLTLTSKPNAIVNRNLTLLNNYPDISDRLNTRHVQFLLLKMFLFKISVLHSKKICHNRLLPYHISNTNYQSVLMEIQI